MRTVKPPSTDRPAILWRRALVLASCLVALLSALAPAQATLPGVNGKILFASGRDGGDAAAKLFFKDASGSQGGGLILGPVVATLLAAAAAVGIRVPAGCTWVRPHVRSFERLRVSLRDAVRYGE